MRHSMSVVAAMSLACSAARGAEPETLTNDTLAQITIDLAAVEPAAGARLLAPYLKKPDPRLTPLIAELLCRGGALPRETQQSLYQALVPLADQRVFKSACAMAASADSTLAQFGLRLLGRCGHAQTSEALIAHFRKTTDEQQRLLVLDALAEAGSAAARSFVIETLKDAKDPDLHAEAAIAAARLGVAVEPRELLRAAAHMAATIRSLNQGLSYAKRAHPKEYLIRVGKLKVLDDRQNRLGVVLKAACQGRAEAVLGLLRAAESPDLAEPAAPYAALLADRLSPEALLPLLAHKSDVLAVAVAKALWEKGGPAQAAVAQTLTQGAKSSDEVLKDRAGLLARAVRAGDSGPAASLVSSPATRARKPSPETGVPYLLWDGHRFGTTPALMDRDVRYYRDLGFTHSQLGTPLGQKQVPEEREQLLDLLAKHDMRVGLYFGWDFAGLTEAWEAMAEKGMTLSLKRQEGMAGFNPLHPEVIRAWCEGALRTVDSYSALKAFDRIQFVLIGSEHTWDLPKPDALPPAARKLILDVARADGVLRPGDDDWTKLGTWWSSAHGKGRDWRLRAAFEDELLKRLPDAECWVDPIWAIKIVHGFGGTWSYIGNDPKRLATAVVRLKAACWPSHCMHSTQLTRQSGGGFIPHDHLIEANLLALCLGADRLYHWGLNTCEPGREENPAYGRKGIKPTPAGFPWFQAGHLPAAGWLPLARRIYAQRSAGVGKRIWQALTPADRELIENEVVLTLKTDGVAPKPPSGKGGTPLQESLLGALNGMLRKPDFYDPEAFRDVKLPERARTLLARHGKQEFWETEDLAELNRLLLESHFAGKSLRSDQAPELALLPLSPSPNLREMRERVRRCRQSIDPAVRSTGRLLRDRGPLFRQWKPLGPRLALLGGIYGEPGPIPALITGHIPFDLLRNPEHRRAALASYRFAATADARISAEDYADLLKIEQAGGTIMVAEGLQTPEGHPGLKKAVAWSPAPGAKKTPDMPRQQREALHVQARALRSLMSQAGFRPYFDTENLDLVMQGYEYRGQPMLLVVNDKRGPSDAEKPDQEDQGRDNEAEFVIREAGQIARVLDIDTGEEMKIARAEDGWRFCDVVPAAWYKIYAVVRKGQKFQGPGPLASAPAIEALKAERDAKTGAVVLSWKSPVDDWVGCDVQWYRIYRGQGEAETEFLAQIDGRITTGPGGLITQYTDASARAGAAYVYRIQAITPLRRLGPLSEKVR